MGCDQTGVQRSGASKLFPARAHAAYGRVNGCIEQVRPQRLVNDAVDRHHPQVPPLLPHQQDANRGDDQVSRQEEQEVEQNDIDSLLLGSPNAHEHDEGQKDDRKNDGEGVLRQYVPAEQPIPRPKQQVAVFPDRLQAAEGPPGALVQQRIDGLRRLRKGNRLIILGDPPTGAMQRQ